MMNEEVWDVWVSVHDGKGRIRQPNLFPLQKFPGKNRQKD